MTPELFDSGVPHSQSEILARIYKEAARRLREIILHPPGGNAIAQQYAQARAAQQLAQVDRILRALNLGTIQWLSDTRDKSGKLLKPSPILVATRDAVKLADQQVIDAGLKPENFPIEGRFSLIDRNVASVFARQIAADLGKAQTSLRGQAGRVIRATAQEKLAESDINKLLAGGVIEGKPVQTMRALRELLQKVHGETVPIPTKNGDIINFDTGYYAELVVRTNTRQAVQTSRHERFQQIGIDTVAIVGKISKNFCTTFLGQVFSLSGTSDKYPPLASLPGGGPPFHPQCSKSTRPYIEELASKTQERQAPGLDDAEQLLDKTPAEAQRMFQDLQIYIQQKDRYAHTAAKLFG